MADIPSAICILLLHTFYGLVITEISIPPPSCIVSDINSPVNIFFRTEVEPEFRGPTDCNTDEPLKALIASGKCQISTSYACNIQDGKACSITIKQSQCEDAGSYVAQDKNGLGHKAFSEVVLRGNHTSPHNSSHYQVTWQLCGNAQLTITCRPTTGQTTSTVCHAQPGTTNCTYLCPYQSNVTCFMELTIFHKCEHKNSTINWTAVIFHDESRTFASTSPPDHTHAETSTTDVQPTAVAVNVGTTTIGFVLVGLGAVAAIVVVLLICRYCLRCPLNDRCTTRQDPGDENVVGDGSNIPLRNTV